MVTNNITMFMVMIVKTILYKETAGLVCYLKCLLW